MRKIFIIPAFLLICVSLFSYNYNVAEPVFEKESILFYGKKKEKAAPLEYGLFLGRNAIGVNISPIIYSALASAGIEYFIPTLISSQTSNKTSLQNNVQVKSFNFALSFNYEFVIFPFMSAAVDMGFANMNSTIYARENLPSPSMGARLDANISMKYKIFSWSAGARFYTGKRAPFGFFLYPKIGGTLIDLQTQGHTSFELDGDVQNLPERTIQTNLYDISVKQHGIYASLELGWRIQLFSKRGAKWKVQPAIDISLFDIGYYFIPWSSQLIKEVNSKILDINSIRGLQQYANIRFLILPRIGFTIRF